MPIRKMIIYCPKCKSTNVGRIIWSLFGEDRVCKDCKHVWSVGEKIKESN